MKIAPRLFGLDSSMVPVGCCAAGVAANRQQQKQRITHTMAWAGWIYIDQQVWLVHWTVVSDGHRLPLPLGLFFFFFFLVWLWRGGKSETIGRIAWWTDPFFFFFFFSGPTKKHITLRVARQARYPKTMHPKTPVTSCFGRRYPQWNRQKERKKEEETSAHGRKKRIAADRRLSQRPRARVIWWRARTRWWLWLLLMLFLDRERGVDAFFKSSVSWLLSLLFACVIIQRRALPRLWRTGHATLAT